MADENLAKRRHIRAEPDSGAYVQIDRADNLAAFECQHVGLLIEESAMAGFSLACLKAVGLQVGAVRRYRVGKMAELHAEVMWERPLDDKVIRYGLRFLE